MDVRSALEELSAKLGPPKHRAAHGQWIPYAWLVRGLVERGHGVTDAVNHVLENSGIPPKEHKQAFGSVRAAYYTIRDREWPADYSNKAAEEASFE